jgi:hypothetical protein
MPTMSVLVGGAAGALITFVLTSCRWWWHRRRLARAAAKQLAPRLSALNTAVTDALADHSWQPLQGAELTDHALPGLTITIANSLPRHATDPFIDGVLAVHELDRARNSLGLTAPGERERIETCRRRIETASTIATNLAD